MQTTVSYNVTSCHQVERYKHIRQTYRLELQGKRDSILPCKTEEGDSSKFSIYLPDYMASFVTIPRSG